MGFPSAGRGSNDITIESHRDTGGIMTKKGSSKAQIGIRGLLRGELSKKIRAMLT